MVGFNHKKVNDKVFGHFGKGSNFAIQSVRTHDTSPRRDVRVPHEAGAGHTLRVAPDAELPRHSLQHDPDGVSGENQSCERQHGDVHNSKMNNPVAVISTRRNITPRQKEMKLASRAGRQKPRGI